jgi:ABC-2 type transport system ATP-binding protein
LCCALIHRPVVLFLDEPTTGVDAVSRKEFWEMLKHLKSQGITVLVSTSYMDEASRCDRVALLQNGSLLAVDAPQTITNQFAKTLLSVKSRQMYHLLQTLRECGFVEHAYPFGEFHHAVLKENVSADDVASFLSTKGFNDVVIHNASANIEDCFMELMRV